MNRTRLLTLAAAACVPLALPSIAAAAPFQNGSFESGSFAANSGTGSDDLAAGSTAITGWTTSNSDIIWIAASNPYVNIEPSNGNYFLDLTGTSDSTQNGTFGSISQAFSTVVGTTYNVSFDLGSSAFYDPTSAAGIEVDVGNGLQVATHSFVYGGPTLTGSQSGYQSETFNFTARTTSTSLTFTGSQGQQYIGLDNVSVAAASSVSAAPEPGAWALMLGGVGAMGLALRSRRRQPKLARVAV